MPQLAVFPKAYMDDLCVHGTMSLREWIEKAATLDVDGLEMYTGILDLKNESYWPEAKKIAADNGLTIPMMCASPVTSAWIAAYGPNTTSSMTLPENRLPMILSTTIDSFTLISPRW